ncbi:hypothetical protein [Reyranella sp.]|uniref:hypothetical protein n=1 Tax=Reyranella sp. TaxID=1929291 RepID=UPI003C7ED1B3
MNTETEYRAVPARRRWAGAALAVALSGLLPSGVAQAEEVEADGWRFNATAYGWLTSVSGNVTAKGQTVDINAGFFDVINNSSSVAAFNGYLEAGKGPVSVYGDLVWSSLGFSKSAARYRNPLPQLTVSGVANAQANYTMTIVEVGGLYELKRWAPSEGSFTALDALLGFRYWNNSVTANLGATITADLYNMGFERSFGLATARSGTLQWIDPVVGLRLRHQFAPGQNVFIRGDVGGFGLGSVFAWQAVAAYTYSWQRQGYALGATLGYRALSTSYTTGSGLDTQGIDLILHGPLIGFSIRF